MNSVERPSQRYTYPLHENNRGRAASLSQALESYRPAMHAGCGPSLAAIVVVIVLGLVASTPGATDLLVAWVK